MRQKNIGTVEAEIEELAATLVKVRDPKFMVAFLGSLLTPSEVDEIGKRWALVKEIAKGRPQRDIAHELHLSLCKITRGSRELRKVDSSFKAMLELAGYEVPPLPGRGGRREKKKPPVVVVAKKKTRGA